MLQSFEKRTIVFENVLRCTVVALSLSVFLCPCFPASTIAENGRRTCLKLKVFVRPSSKSLQLQQKHWHGACLTLVMYFPCSQYLNAFWMTPCSLLNMSVSYLMTAPILLTSGYHCFYPKTSEGMNDLKEVNCTCLVNVVMSLGLGDLCFTGLGELLSLIIPIISISISRQLCENYRCTWPCFWRKRQSRQFIRTPRLVWLSALFYDLIF